MAANSSTGFALSDDLPTSALADRFRTTGRVHIPNVLAGESAKILHNCMMRRIRWQTAFLHQNRHVDFGREYTAILDQMKQRLLADGIYSQAKNSFTYVYNNFPIADTYKQENRPELPVYDLYEFINSEPFLDYMRRVTGLKNIVKADAQATMFRAGHFLTEHDDDLAEQHRLAAYVLNLTPEWRIDWGGLLAFHGDDGHVTEAFTPSFNALNIFRVPMRHSVTFVTPFCPAGRYSITGWLRSG